MPAHELVIVGGSRRLWERPGVAETVALWCGGRGRHAEVSYRTFAEFVERIVSADGYAAAWVLDDATQAHLLHDVLGVLTDAHVPVLFSRFDTAADATTAPAHGVALAPADGSPAVLAAMLDATWAQASNVRALKSEIHLLRMQQGGLCEQIELLDEELRLAAQLQRELLPPPLPTVHDVDFHILYRPAGYVSGDIYDIERLDEDHVGFFVADAVGHGVPAALMTMFIKRALHLKIIDPGLPKGYRIVPPDEALTRLNHDLTRQTRAGRLRHATAVCGVINCRTRQISVARAGHPYPMVLRSDRHVDSLEPDGAILGIFPDETFEMVTTRLRPGDRLLFYTDGFEVAFREQSSGRIANTQYEQEFRKLGVGSVENALRKLADDLDQQLGSLNQRDDLTVLCVDVGAHQAGGVADAPVRAAG